MAGCSTVRTPTVKEVDAFDSEVDPELDGYEAAVFRNASMSLLYLAQELFFSQYAVKELARPLSPRRI